VLTALTRDVQVAVYRNSGAYDEVLVDMEHTTVNAVTIRFTTPPAANAFRVVVIG
jgi:2-keto-3-deoxy-L-rhamnonate aldolase RhmA